MTSFTGKSKQELARSVKNDSFFSDLSVGDFQRNYRIPAEYAIDMVENDLTLAAQSINHELIEQRLIWAAAGYGTLKAAEEALTKPFTLWYLNAVYALAKSNLLTQFATINQRSAANNAAKTSAETHNAFKAMSNIAVRRLKGLGNITAELL